MEGNSDKYINENSMFVFEIVVGYLSIVKIQMKFVAIGLKY
jgi:hypothetical protein